MTLQRQIGFWVGSLLVFVLFLVVLRDVLLPFIAALALAYLLDPLADRLERMGMSRMVATIVILVVFLLIFVLALVLLGYTISTVARTQLQAMQLTFFFFLPSLMLSGFMFPFRGMPAWAQWLGEILPATHFMRLVRGLMLKGAELGDVTGNLLALAAILLVVSALAISRYKVTLD